MIGRRGLITGAAAVAAYGGLAEAQQVGRPGLPRSYRPGLTYPPAVAAVVANSITWDPSATIPSSTPQFTFSNGNRTASSTTTNQVGVNANKSATSGKVYWECSFTFPAGGSDPLIALVDSTQTNYPWIIQSSSTANTMGVLTQTSTGSFNQGVTPANANVVSGATFGLACDLTGKTISIYAANSFLGTYSWTANTAGMAFFPNCEDNSVGHTFTISSGTSLTYAPPSGYVSL